MAAQEVERGKAHAPADVAEIMKQIVNKQRVWIEPAHYQANRDLFRCYFKGPKSKKGEQARHLHIFERTFFRRLFAGIIPRHGDNKTVCVELTARRLRG